MMLSDVRDYVATLNITPNVYMGKTDAKKEKSIGIYHLKQNRQPSIFLGQTGSYNTKGISLLIHGNKSPRETEEIAIKLYTILEKCRNIEINNKKILFIEHLHNEPIFVDTDQNGIHEYVIECLFYYER